MAKQLYRVENRHDDWKIELELDVTDVNRCLPYSQDEHVRDARADFGIVVRNAVARIRELNMPSYRQKVFAEVLQAVVYFFGQEFLDENPFVFGDLKLTNLSSVEL